MTMGGYARLADIILEYLWLLAVVLVLAIKPIRGRTHEVGASTADARPM
jgi:hypothetical protein